MTPAPEFLWESRSANLLKLHEQCSDIRKNFSYASCVCRGTRQQLLRWEVSLSSSIDNFVGKNASLERFESFRGSSPASLAE